MHFNSNYMNTKNFLVLLRFVIAGTFIFSAISKLISIGVFEITLIDQGIMADRTAAAYFARFLIGVELSIGILFLQPFNIKKIIIPISFFMLIVFSAQLIYLMIIGDSRNCGCFGNIVKMSPVESLIKNILLIIIVGFVYLKSKVKSQNKSFLFILPIAAISFVFILSPIKSIKNFKFSKYTHFKNAGRVDLSNGDKLLAVFDLECEHCQAAATEMGKLQRADEKISGFLCSIFRRGRCISGYI